MNPQTRGIFFGIAAAGLMAAAMWLMNAGSGTPARPAAYDGDFQARPAAEVVDQKLRVTSGVRGVQSAQPARLNADAKPADTPVAPAKRRKDDETVTPK